MQTEAKPKATDDRRDFVLIPADQVRVAPSDAEITDLLRAAARHHSEAGVRPAPDPSVPVPAVDTTFRATAVNEDLPVRGSTFGRRLVRMVAALLLAAGIGGAAFGWQVFGYAAKKAVGRWLPQIALTSSLSLDKLGLAPEPKPSEDATDAAPATASAQDAAVSAPSVADSGAPANAAAAPPDATQQLQSMARDLANANQEVEALKASIAELKAGQQQMARELTKMSDKLAEQNARAKVTSAAQHAAAAARKPAALYSPTPTPAPPTYRPSYSAQAAATVASPPVTAHPSAPPPPISLQPQADPGLPATAPRPPLPVQ